MKRRRRDQQIFDPVQALQNEVENINAKLSIARQVAEEMTAEKQEIAAINEQLSQHSKQVEAEKQSVQLELGNTATLLQVIIFPIVFCFLYLLFLFIFL